MTPAIDATYAALVAELPASLRAEASTLPARLRVPTDDAVSWEGYPRLEAMSDLPAFAAEDPRRPGALIVSPASLARYRVAHYCAGYYTGLHARLAERQGAAPRADALLGRALRGFWCRELARATSDPALAAREIDSSMAAWRRGVRIERVARLRVDAGAPVPLGVHMRAVALQARWAAASAVCLLARNGQGARVRAFRRAYGLMLVSLRCIDDAQYAAEDEARLGASVPAALGVSPDAMLAASPAIARLAARAASVARFHRLGAWLAARAELCEALAAPRDRAAGARAAEVLVDAARRRFGAVRYDA